MKKRVLPILVIVILVTVVGLLAYLRREYTRKVIALTSMDPQQV